MKINDIFYLIGENHKFTEDFIYKNQGEYPIYSATLDKPYGYCNSFEYDKEIILIVNYGDAGKTRLISGKYNIGRNVSAIYPKENYKNEINLKYFRIILENKLLSMMDKSNMGCFSQSSLKNVEVDYPFPSMEEQNAIVEQYEKLEELKNKMKKKIVVLQLLMKSELKLKSFEEVTVDKIALLNKGSNKISEKMIYENYDLEGIPVYSSATENNGLMGKITLECYDNFNKKGNENELTWATNGYAGKVFYRDTKYLYSEKCGRIIIREEYKDKILPKFLCYMLNQVTYKYKTSESNNGKLDIIHMEKIPVKVPLNENGLFDIDMQNKIVRIYDKIVALENNLEKIVKNVE